MIDPYRPESWHDFFLGAAGAGAALAGLLFVALSLHIRFVTSSQVHRGMARGSLGGLVMVLVISLIALIPQTAQWIGAEFILVGLVYALAVGTGQVAHLRRMGYPLPSLVRVVLGYLLAVVGFWGGLGLLLRFGGGLYWVALQVIAIIVWNLMNAWSLLMGISADES